MYIPHYHNSYIPYPILYSMETTTCKYCDKVIEGHTVNQVQYMLKQHVISKHFDKIEITEKKGK